MPQLVAKMKRARINKALPAALRRSVIDEELRELVGITDSPLIMEGLEMPSKPFTSIEDILNFTKKLK